MSGPFLYLAQSGLGLVLFYAVFRLALRDDTHFQANRFYLLASLVAAHLVPLVPVTSPFRPVVAPASLPADVVGATASAGMDAWPLALALARLVYAAGAALVLARLAWQLRRLLALVGRHPVVLRDGIRLVYVEEDWPPFSFFRTAFVRRPSDGDGEVLEQIVAHERTHIRQRHWLDLLLVHAASVGQWFNPVVWLYKEAFQEIHEHLADRAVLARGFDSSGYGRLLLEQRLGARSFELVHHLRESQIKRRLAMMTRSSDRWTAVKHLLGLPALGLLVVGFAQPRVVVGSGVAAPGPTASPSSMAQAARPGQATTASSSAGEKTVIEKKQLDAALEKKMAALKEEYLAATDPHKKQAIKDEMAKLQQHHDQQVVTLDLSDPAAVEKAMVQIAKKLEALQAKGLEAADEVTQKKIQDEVETLTKKIQMLKARLAELRAAR